MVADWMNSCFLISYSTAIYVIQAKKGFCSSSSYLILLMHISRTSLGDWKKCETSRTVIKIQINNLFQASIWMLFILEEDE
ncbi:hypothetical protein COJ60_29640 [Bacillus cereus]|nr:hypothetical protein YBT020_01935 [Bacillus thuringiensis serovar finitimus YBT-020]OTX74355.1 hypothetical protein BK722_06765 [Bacillus thuringiensis serovar finitimus]PFN29419.1 hypothetical protein COJ60_29640 [Bacillus cereus]RAT04554.1 hypothetical protein A6E22_16910 [Bacillus cereus]